MTSRTKERLWEGALLLVVSGTGIGLAAAKLGEPLGVDEAWTAGQYVLEPFLVAATKYDEPNNHVFHTLLAWIAHRVAGPSLVALRIPAFLAWCLLLPAVWWFVRQESGRLEAVLATTFVATSRFLVEYGSSARGYALVLLLFVLALLTGRRLVRAPRDHLRWALWAAVLALGFFTVPVMAFPAAALAAWMLIKRRRQGGAQRMAGFAVRIAGWSATAAALGLILYLPAMASQGAFALLGNEFVDSVDRTPGVYVPLHLWPGWHLTAPMWSQAVVLAAAVIGTVATRAASTGGPTKANRPGGRLAVAAGTGMTAVLLAWPVVLWPRAATWLLLCILIVAGIGVGFAAGTGLVGTARTTLGGGRNRLASTAGTVVVLLFLGVFAWLARLPLPQGSFPEWDPVRFPYTGVMIKAVAEDVRFGDCVSVAINADIGFPYTNALAARTYFKAAGVQVARNYEARAMRRTRTAAYYRAAHRHDIAMHPSVCPPFAAASLDWVTSPVSGVSGMSSSLGQRPPGQPSPDQPAPGQPPSDQADTGQLFILDAGFRPRDRNTVGDREVQAFLEATGLQHEVAADFAGGRAYRLAASSLTSIRSSGRRRQRRATGQSTLPRQGGSSRRRQGRRCATGGPARRR